MRNVEGMTERRGAGFDRGAGFLLKMLYVTGLNPTTAK